MGKMQAHNGNDAILPTYKDLVLLAAHISDMHLLIHLQHDHIKGLKLL